MPLSPGLAFITGATGGIGQSLSRELATRGWKLALHGRDPRRLRTLAEEIVHDGGTVAATYVADLGNLHDVVELCARLREDFPGIDLVFNNAATGFIDPTRGCWRDSPLFKVNLISPFIICSRLLPGLAAGRGRIVNVASLADVPLDEPLGLSHSADPFAAYAQTKRALVMMTQALTAGVLPAGIKLVSVHPGSLIPTGLSRRMLSVVAPGLAAPLQDALAAAPSPAAAARYLADLATTAPDVLASGAFYVNGGATRIPTAMFGRDACDRVRVTLDDLLSDLPGWKIAAIPQIRERSCLAGGYQA